MQIDITNFLLIGYTAWKGFIESGRGCVVCYLYEVGLSPSASAKKNSFLFPLMMGRSKGIQNEESLSPGDIQGIHFVTKPILKAYLNEWILEKESTKYILEQVDTYNPETDVLMLIKIGSQIEVNVLPNVAISPSECYKQVCDKWDNFRDYIS